jgi:imidazolonepropionase-like amidohydrolase
MQRSWWLWWFVLGCSAGATAPGPAAPPVAPAAAFVAQPGDTAFRDATVVAMTGDGELPHHTVVIRGDRIAAVAPSARVELPDGVTVIDGAGKWLMPGLADMHVHTWHDDDLTLFLAAGVTTIRNMWGIPQHVAWRTQIARGERLGPTIVTAGDLIDGAPPDWPGSVVLTDPDAADRLVAAQKAAGYDFLKSVARLSPAAYRALAAAGERHGMPLAGHVTVSVGLDGALAARQRSIEHVDGYLDALVPPGVALPSIDDEPARSRAVVAALDPARLPGLIERTIAAGTWNCATLIVYDRLPELSGAALAPRVAWLAEVPAARRARWLHSFAATRTDSEAAAAYRALTAETGKVVAALAAAGAPLLIGTDSGVPFVIPGEALHDEIELMVAAGVPRPQVLRAATAGAWRYLGQPREAGIVEAGARADLLLVASDPLTGPLPLVPDGAMVRGRWLPRAELEAKLADIAARAAAPADPWAAAPPLPADGAPLRYDVTLDGTWVGAERLAITAAGGHRAIAGQIVDPGSALDTTYRITRDAAQLTAAYHTFTGELTGKLAGGALVVTGTDMSHQPVSLRAPVPPGAFLAGPGIAGLVPVVERLAGLPPGGRRTLTALEIGFPAIVTARHTVVRRPDAGGNRVYAVTTTRDGATATSELVVDRDGLIVGRSDAAPADTKVTRQPR